MFQPFQNLSYKTAIIQFFLQSILGPSSLESSSQDMIYFFIYIDVFLDVALVTVYSPQKTESPRNLSHKMKGKHFTVYNCPLLARDSSCRPRPARQCRLRRKGWIAGWMIDGRGGLSGAQFPPFPAQRAFSPVSRASRG